MINITRNLLESDKLFDKIADELDISPSLYKTAVDHYTAIGNWLDQINLIGVFEGSEDPIPTKKISADIFPQGSFALGTVVKPWAGGEEQEYDIDLVFQLDLEIGTKQAYALKKAVGERLKEHSTYREMLKEEGKRCWTVVYAEQGNTQFHLDILPALNGGNSPGVAHRDKEIGISNKISSANYEWLPSNPRGYAAWFKEMNQVAFNRVAAFERKRTFIMDEAIFATVHDVPDQLIRTPLQRAIQILKRHRDVRFSGHPYEKEKPISMIITTLAALSYGNEESISHTLENIINKLLSHKSLTNGRAPVNVQSLIERTVDGEWIIRNPVCLEENFADKWYLDDHKRAKAFFQWLEWLEQDMTLLVEQNKQSNQRALLEEKFGSRVAFAVAPLPASVGAGLLVHNSHGEDVIVESPSQPWRRGV